MSKRKYRPVLPQFPHLRPKPKPTPTWSAVSFAGTPIGDVESVHVSDGGPGRMGLVERPRAAFRTRDIGAAMALRYGRSGEFRATVADADGRGVEFVLVNAAVDNIGGRAVYGMFGTASAGLASHSSDGNTNPLSFTAAGGPPRAVPDALLMPESLKAGDDQLARVASVLDVAEPILGVDRSAGGRAWIRRQPGGRLFVSRDPRDTLFHPAGHALAGQPRYRWAAGFDGIEFGTLIPETPACTPT